MKLGRLLFVSFEVAVFRNPRKGHFGGVNCVASVIHSWVRFVTVVVNDPPLTQFSH